MSTDVTQLVELGWQSLAVVGGGGALISAVSGFVSQHFASKALEKQKGEISREIESLKATFAKELETHKYDIKKQELIFERDIEAAQAVTRLNEAVRPQYQPDMDWHEACVAVGWELLAVENALKEFRLKFGYLLSTEHRELLKKLQWSAGEEKFGLPDDHEAEPPKAAIEAAAEIIEKLGELEDALVSKVR